MLRSTAIFGSVMMVAPFWRSDQGRIKSAFEAAARAARAAAAFLSSAATRSAAPAGRGGGGSGLPPGIRSSSSCSMVSTPHDGMLARWVASHTMVPDFGCGRQSNRFSGTRSSVFRAPVTSWSNSGSMLSPIVM